jgi:hypothetical protein
VLVSSTTGLQVLLLQAFRRPVVELLRQSQTLPQVFEVVSDYAYPQPNLVGPEPMATQHSQGRQLSTPSSNPPLEKEELQKICIETDNMRGANFSWCSFAREV